MIERSEITDLLFGYEHGLADAARFTKRVAIRSEAKDQLTELLARAWDEGRAEAMEDSEFAAGFADRANPYRPQGAGTDA